MRPRCILHVGMPKTGSSSIQETLFFGLDDPRFLYVSAGEINAVRAILLLCTDSTPPARVLGSATSDSGFLDRRRRSYRRKVEASLRRARAHGLQPILSAESCWRMSEDELQRLRSLLEREGFAVRVVAYLRTWKEWIESSYQQHCKNECVHGSKPWTVAFAPPNPSLLRYRDRFETVDRVFGRENVLLRKFDPRSFPGRDIVRDFCHQLGISIPEGCIRRANESLSLDALKLLVAYGRFGNREPGWGRRSARQYRWLLRRLRDLSGPPLRLHSSLVEPMIAPVLPQLDWLEERLGAPMREDLGAHDATPECIRSDEDLMRFSGESLRWLSEVAGGGPISGTSGEETARQVGDRVHRLRHSFPGAGILGHSARTAVESSWVRWVKGA